MHIIMVTCHSSNESAFNEQQNDLNWEPMDNMHGHRFMVVFLNACATTKIFLGSYLGRWYTP